MQLRRFRRQYEQLSQFERGRFIGMMEAGWSARRVARQLGCSDCVVRRCWGNWIQLVPVGNTRSPLVLIRGTMTAQRYVHDILQTHVLPLMQRLPEAIFSTRQCSASHDKGVTRLSTHCYYASFLGLPDPQICLQSNLSGIIWDGKLGIPRV
ncbi:uncharacterized protein TNCV_1333581 [Trichonephila clavipes]|nr:uncharacterized protein TNCV_1333581 [Trichonephila clavipes]